MKITIKTPSHKSVTIQRTAGIFDNLTGGRRGACIIESFSIG